MKKLFSGGDAEAMPTLMRLDLHVGDAAIALAGEFNAAMAGTRTRALRFNRGLALTVGAAGTRSGFAQDEWVTVEDFYPGVFEKLVSNTGLVAYENNRGSRAPGEEGRTRTGSPEDALSFPSQARDVLPLDVRPDQG